MLDRLSRLVRTRLYHSLVAVGFGAFVLLGYLFGGKEFVAEWGGAVAAAICIFALIFKSSGYWTWSIVNASLWLVLFAGTLPMLAGLQVSYIIFACYGLWQWANVKWRIGYDHSVWTDNLGTAISLAIFVYTVYAYVGLEGYAFTTWWWVEFFGVFISIASNWMDAFKYKGNWVGWTATNLLFGPLFFHLGLWGPFVMTFVYQAFCCIGFYRWYREEKQLAAAGKVKLVGGARYA